jgi:hypothetical protein
MIAHPIPAGPHARYFAVIRLTRERYRADRATRIANETFGPVTDCGSEHAKCWQVAWDAVMVALGGAPDEYRGAGPWPDKRAYYPDLATERSAGCLIIGDAVRRPGDWWRSTVSDLDALKGTAALSWIAMGDEGEFMAARRPLSDLTLVLED